MASSEAGNVVEPLATPPAQMMEPQDMGVLLNQVKVKVARVNVSGNRRSEADWVRSEYKSSFDSKTLAECYETTALNSQNLLQHGVFRGVSADIKYDDDAPEISETERIVPVQVTVNLKEKRMLSASVGATTVPGTGDHRGTATFHLCNPLFGRGEKLDFRTERGKDSYVFNGTLSQHKPWGWPVKLAVSGFRDKDDYTQIASFSELSTGGSISVSDLSHGHRLTYTGALRENTVAPKASTSVIKESVKPSVKSSLAYTRTFDRRNHPFTPTNGYYLSGTAEVAGLGGDVKFVKAQSTASWFFPVFHPKVALGFTASVGILRPWSALKANATEADKNTHINDRFFLGGISNLRGFSTGRIGIKDSADALGGDLKTAIGANFSFPLPGPFGDQGLRFHFFGTAGNVTRLNGPDSFSQSCRKNIQDARLSLGCGLVWPLPIGGRLEINFARPFSADQSEWKQRRLEVDFGFEFM